MSDFAVVVSALRHVSTTTQSAGSDLESELCRLRRGADGVLTGQWLGRAAEAFDRAWSSWDAAAREIVAALDELAELLATTARAYEVDDDAAAAQLRRVAS